MNMEIFDANSFDPTGAIEFIDGKTPFLFVMMGDEMHPVLWSSDRLTIDPRVEVKSGDLALVRVIISDPQSFAKSHKHLKTTDPRNAVYMVRKVIFDVDTISLCRYSDLMDMDRKPDAFTRFDRRVDFPNCTIMGRVMSVHRSMCPNEKFGGRTGVNYTMSEISPAFAGKWQQSSQNNSDHWVFFSKNSFSEKK